MTLGRALRLSHLIPGVAHLEAELARAVDSGVVPQSAIILANDWTALPAALSAYRRHGMPFHYDTHEFALEEHSTNRVWRLLFPRLIEQIENEALRCAQSVSCVSPGIAKAMRAHYQLVETPIVIRNVPHVRPLTPRRNERPFKVLYHGLFKPDRGLERLLRSVPRWPKHFHLVLRGRAPNPAYQTAIEDLSARIGHERVTLEPMVPLSEVVEAASHCDIGVLLFDLASKQNRFALPNKLFEYLHAGLVPLVSAGTDAAELIEQYGVGSAIAPNDDDALIRLLEQLDADSLFRRKLASYQAAMSLTWEQEARKLRDILPPR